MWVREMIRERKDVGEYHTLYHGCANHATEGKCFCPPSTVVTQRSLSTCSVANYVLHPCTLIACTYVYTVCCRRGGQCFSVLRTRHADVVGDSSGTSYVTEQGHNVPLLRTRGLHNARESLWPPLMLLLYYSGGQPRSEARLSRAKHLFDGKNNAKSN